MLKVSTFCSGIGAAEEALKNLGVEHEVVFASEIDKYARQSYEVNHDAKMMINDMCEPDYVGEQYYSDLNISGLPCQAFSLAGKRLGELDKRGVLFYDFYRWVKNQQPKVFVIENVKGLLSSISVSTFDNISLSLLYKFETTKWESFNTQKNNWNSLEITISNYLLMILHQKSELPKQELDILLTKNLELDIENLEQKVKDGLNKRWKYLEEKICQITKKSNSCQEERTQPLEHKDCASDLNHEQSYLIENLKIKVINLLEQTEHINVNTDLFANLISEENSEKMRMFTTLMEINSTMNSQTCIYAVEINIVRCIILALDLYRNLWKEVWSILTKKKEFTSIKTFDIWMSNLSVLGYNLHHTVLNSKNFGVPQNRERVFIVGIRKDLPNDFRFPVGWKLDKRLRDVLETNVDEKYYLSEKMMNYLNTRKDNFNNGKINYKTGVDIASCINASSKSLDISDNIIVEGEVTPNSQAGKIYGIDGISPTLSAGTHGYAQGYVKVPEATKKGFDIAEVGDSINLSNPNSTTPRGRVGKGIANTLDTSCNQAVIEPFCVAMRGRNPVNPSDRTVGAETEQRLEANSQGITNTLTSVQKDNLIVEPQIYQTPRGFNKGGLHDICPPITSNSFENNNHIVEPELVQIAQIDGFESEGRVYDANGLARTIKDGGGGGSGSKTGWYDTGAKIRRLLPIETFRLQGYSDEFFYKCQAVNSDTRLYQQAGNTITVSVIQAIIKNLLHILK